MKRTPVCCLLQRYFPPFLPLLLLVFAWTNPSVASTKDLPEGNSKRVPASLIHWPKNASEYAVLVDKSTQRVIVYRWDNLFTPVKVYEASTGENDGPKSRLNDRKTPEGIYFFTDAYLERELAPIYGSRAFPIDYPSPLDRKQGRGGYGIWFHGTNKLLKPKDTNGCIALDNPNIDELANYIRLHDTPVVISSKIEMISPDQLKRERRQLLKTIEGWRRAWERKEIDRYMSFYSRRFSSALKDWKAWKRYKAVLARRYRRIRVELRNLRVLKNDGVVLALFDQRYKTERFESRGQKRLYLTQNSKEWKIVGEFFHRERVRRLAPREIYAYNLEDIKRFIMSWKGAWEGKDLEAYISSYDSGFRSRGMNLKTWKRHRERLNAKYRSVKVEIKDLSIVQVSDRKAKVSFKQIYRADGYHDFGLKNLLLVKRGERWKIKEEKWRALK